jgi:hypothetical protein
VKYWSQCILAAAVSALAITAAARAEVSLSLSDNFTNTNVSGVTANKIVLEGVQANGLKSLEVNEQSDEPCLVRATEAPLNNPTGDSIILEDRCRNGGSAGADQSAVFPGRTFVSAVRVCLNGDHDRVKGYELKGRVLAADGTLSAASTRPIDQKPNCRDWMDWAECGPGQIASGLNLHFEGGSEPRSLKGIGLKCRTVEATNVVAETSVTGSVDETARAGLQGGTGRVLKPGNSNDNFVFAIVWSERSDNPCYLKAKGRTFGAQTRNISDDYNGCNGEPGNSSQREAGRGEGVKHPAAGIRVCIKNDKVKGIELEYWNAEDTRSPRYTYASGVDTQPNCRVGDREWTDWRRCAEGSVAVGIKGYFDTSGGGPASLRAISLLCRRLNE